MCLLMQYGQSTTLLRKFSMRLPFDWTATIATPSSGTTITDALLPISLSKHLFCHEDLDNGIHHEIRRGARYVPGCCRSNHPPSVYAQVQSNGNPGTHSWQWIQARLIHSEQEVDQQAFRPPCLLINDAYSPSYLKIWSLHLFSTQHHSSPDSAIHINEAHQAPVEVSRLAVVIFSHSSDSSGCRTMYFTCSYFCDPLNLHINCI